MVGMGKAMMGEGAQTMEESIGEREEEYVGMAKKEKKMLMVEGEGEGEGGVERMRVGWGRGVGRRRHHASTLHMLF